MIFRRHTFLRAFSIILLAFLFIYELPVTSAAADTDTSTDTYEFTWPTGPSVYADAAIVMEATTGLILYEKNIYTAYYPASITKILTALLALENCSLSEIVTMSEAAQKNVYGSQIGLVEGEQVTLEDAMYGMMLDSANEVSYAIGEHVAAKVNSSSGSMEEFAAIMNARAAELGCVNSHFTNSHGLHDANHYTCAYDMALISQAAIATPHFRTIAGARTHVIPPTNKNVTRYLAHHHRFINTNNTVPHYDYTIAGKTGATNEALSTLVTYAEKDGMLLIAVVLHVDTSLHAYEDTIKILNFAFDNYSIYGIEDTELGSDTEFPSLFSQTQDFASGLDTLIRVSENGNIVLPNSVSYSDTTKTITYTPVEEFVHGDNVIGQISYQFGGKTVGLADILYYNPNYPITRAEFEARWPGYLIPPDVVFADGVPESSESNPSGDDSANNQDTAEDSDQKDSASKKSIFPLVVGVVIAILVLAAGAYIVFVEIPHRKRRKAYKRRHNARINSYSSGRHDDYNI